MGIVRPNCGLADPLAVLRSATLHLTMPSLLNDPPTWLMPAVVVMLIDLAASRFDQSA